MGKINFLFIIFSILFMNISLFTSDTATRDLPDYYTAGSNFEVTIYVNTDTQNPPTGVIISETLPSNWSIISSNPQWSKYQSSTNTYKWLKFNSSGVSPFTITYTVSVPEGTTGTYEFSGIINTTTSGEVSIEGDTYISDNIQKGDINGDGEVDISDVILCLRQAVELDPPQPDLADINEDGEIDISDVILILRIAVGLD
ncbi:dockerin type I repeat-containing protein [bacterium]|nr:dockerin type I repeat-containing protein [bacterium]